MSVYSESFLQNQIVNYKLILIKNHKRKVEDTSITLQSTNPKEPLSPQVIPITDKPKTLQRPLLQKSKGALTPKYVKLHARINPTRKEIQINLIHYSMVKIQHLGIQQWDNDTLYKKQCPIKTKGIIKQYNLQQQLIRILFKAFIIPKREQLKQSPPKQNFYLLKLTEKRAHQRALQTLLHLCQNLKLIKIHLRYINKIISQRKNKLVFKRKVSCRSQRGLVRENLERELIVLILFMEVDMAIT
ncbi:UNKNOWN [Stylonychia lemnae]|uniref:Uncharacterized protein n=1 Tax=Stylonychia lemnae TaxID=5949 RepID=A0A078B8G4_STYLE|nr:UNKNOWN [Stylonychia lemnae]|eukprot:CDW90486.1 UNKNOWN [Stylonychia lemnae]